MAGASDSGNSSGLEVRTVHDGGVEFVLPGGGEDGSPPSVEERIVLHKADSGLDGVEGRSTLVENVGGFLDGRLKIGAVGGLRLRVHVAALDNACSTMEDDGPPVDF